MHRLLPLARQCTNINGIIKQKILVYSIVLLEHISLSELSSLTLDTFIINYYRDTADLGGSEIV